MTHEDDILRGVRAAREAFAATHGFDPHVMAAALRSLDATGDWPVIRALKPEPARASLSPGQQPSPLGVMLSAQGSEETAR